MQKNTLGETIRSLRKKAGLSQEELADGVCSAVSISRIENGSQMPSRIVLEGLLSKLGVGIYQICNIFYMSENQRAFEERADLINTLISEEKWAEAKEQLSALAENAKESAANEQLTLLLDSSIRLHEQEPPDEILALLKKALALTKPGIDFFDLRNTLLSIREVNILNALLVTLIRLDKIEEAIRLGEELTAALKKHESGLKEYQILKINLMFNLAQCMEMEGRYKEELKYIELAEDLSMDSAEQMLLPEIEFIKAKANHLLGNDDACAKILKAIIPYMELIHKAGFAQLARDYALKELQLVI